MTSTVTDQVGGLGSGVAFKPPCRSATTANITLFGLQTIDTEVLAEGDRVLVKNQTDTTENGIYIAGASDWTRSKDFDGPRDIVRGTRVAVWGGTAGDGEYEVLSSNPITPGSSAITFAAVSGGVGGAVDSVNGADGDVVLDADDISDAGTTHKFTTAGDITKLSGIETGATADMTAAEILTAIKTVDGSGSGLDADTLDGSSSAAFAAAVHAHLVADLSDASANGRLLLQAANYAAMKTLLDLEAGTDFNAYSARLADVAGVTWNQGDLLYYNGSNLADLGPGTSGQFLKTQGAGANPVWDDAPGAGGGISNVVEDTSPQLGGDLDVNGHAVGAAEAADLTKLNALTATAIELNYVDGVTSAIQTQLDGKQVSNSDLTAIAALTTTAFGRGLLTEADQASLLATVLPTVTSEPDVSADWANPAHGEEYLLSWGEHSAGAIADADGVIAVGPGAMSAATAASTIIAIGHNALGQVVDPGSFQIAIGSHALPYASGSRNVAVGVLAGHFVTTGEWNGYYGRNAGHANTTGSRNIGVGYRAVGAAENPIWFDGTIHNTWALTADDQTGVGTDALRYSNGPFNTSLGKGSLGNVKTGSRNVAVGGASLGVLDSLTSYDAKVITDVNIAGTYSQTLTTVSVAATGVNAVVGNLVALAFSTGAISTATADTVWVEVVTAPNANSFTFTSPVSQTASGNCTVDKVESNVAATISERNVAVGHNAGGELLTGTRNVIIGADAATAATAFAGGTSFSNRLVIGSQATGRPIIVGDFANGYVSINGADADLDHPFGVFERTGGTELLRIAANGVHFLSWTDDSASAGPVWTLQRESASPAANDVIGSIRYSGRDSANVVNNYADIYCEILDPTATNEDARLNFRAQVAGAMAVRMWYGAGLVIGSAGTDPGVGNLNIHSGELRMANTKVLGARIAGWGAPTGTPTRTTFATGSVTLPQLAERVKALIDDLTTHGAIGA
jgi:hypothetical protein